MAFPKTQSGSDLMLEAPSPPEPGQYDELGLRFVGIPDEAAERHDAGARHLSDATGLGIRRSTRSPVGRVWRP